MKVKCFACDASIEAEGADDVVDAFVVHGGAGRLWLPIVLTDARGWNRISKYRSK